MTLTASGTSEASPASLLSPAATPVGAGRGTDGVVMAAVAPPDRDPLDDLDLPRLVAAMIVEAIVSYAAWRRRLGRGTVDRPSHVERAGKAAEAFLYGAGAMRQSRHGLLAYLGFAPEAADAALHRLRDDPERLAEIERFVKSMQCQKSQIGTQERRERREAQHDDYE